MDALVICTIGCSDDNGNFFFYFLKMAGVEKVVTAYKKQCGNLFSVIVTGIKGPPGY